MHRATPQSSLLDHPDLRLHSIATPLDENIQRDCFLPLCSLCLCRRKFEGSSLLLLQWQRQHVSSGWDTRAPRRTHSRTSKKTRCLWSLSEFPSWNPGSLTWCMIGWKWGLVHFLHLFSFWTSTFKSLLFPNAAAAHHPPITAIWLTAGWDAEANFSSKFQHLNIDHYSQFHV